jgi:hypothetical protein
LLLVIAAICAGLGASRLKRPPPHFPSLTSRLRVAVKANPLKSAHLDAAGDTAAAALRAPARANRQWAKAGRSSPEVSAGLILAATLLSWAATRRRQQARRMRA